VLTFVYPTLQYPKAPKKEVAENEDQHEEPAENNDAENQIPKFSYGEFFPLDPEGSKVLLMARHSSYWTYVFFTIDTNDWTVAKVATSAELATPRTLGYMDSSAQRLYFVGQTMSGDAKDSFQLSFRYLDCKTWETTPSAIMNLTCTREMLDYEPNTAPVIIQYISGYIYVWHPLGTHAIRAKVDFTGEEPYPIPEWENVKFLGTVSRTTHYTVQQSSAPGTMFAFAGWDDSAQSNNFHIVQLVETPTGSKDDDGRMITEPALKWSRPHRSGSVPRPRNDTAIIPLDTKRLFIFGGWNGRNYIDDSELVTVLDSRKKDPLLSLLEDDELQRLTYDVTIALKEDKLVRCSKVLLFARCKFFRDLLESDPGAQIIDLRTIPIDLFYPFLYYLHADVMDSESIDAGSIHMFYDGIVQRFGAEHITRVFQELYAAEVIVQSSLGSNLEEFAWKNETFSDVTFRVPDESGSGFVTFSAHRSIVRYFDRNPDFHALIF
jgi:hypothetical protein